MAARARLVADRGLRDRLAIFGAVGLVLAFALALLGRDPGFFWANDFQVQYLPAFRDTARAWAEGEWPLLSPASWSGGGLAGEYQYGTFSVFIQLVVVLAWRLDLTLAGTAAFLSLVHLGVLAAGAFSLARHRGLTHDLATLVALVASLNGWMICWGAVDWIPALLSFAWIPWAWRALERACEPSRSRWRFLPAAAFIYLVLAAGWPFSDAMLGLVTLMVLARARDRARRVADLWPAVAAWAVGLSLAMPALLMLVEYTRAGLRLERFPVFWQWSVPPGALIGLFTPSVLTEWQAWEGPESRPSIELACGLVPPVALLVALARFRGSFARRRRWQLALLLVALGLAMLPSALVFQRTFRWLALFHLCLGLLAAEALAALRDAEGRLPGNGFTWRHLSGSQIAAGLLAILVVQRLIDSLSTGLLRYLDLGSLLVLLALSLTLLCALIYVCWRWARPRRAVPGGLQRWLPCVVVVLSLWSTYSSLPTKYVTVWELPERIRSPEPFEPDRLYLAMYRKEEAYQRRGTASVWLRQANVPMYAGLDFVNGFTAIRPWGLARVLGIGSYLGYMSDPEVLHVVEREAGPRGLLELMGVDGLVLSRGFGEHAQALLRQGWAVTARSEYATILHRVQGLRRAARAFGSAEVVVSREEARGRIRERDAEPVPLLLVVNGADAAAGERRYAPCRLEVLRESRLGAALRLEPLASEGTSLIVFSRPWYPGYRATFAGRPLEVRALNALLPAVEVPAGRGGVLELEYFPRSLAIGLAFAFAALILTLAGAAAWLWERAYGDSGSESGSDPGTAVGSSR